MELDTALQLAIAILALAGAAGAGRYWALRKAGQALAAAREVRDVFKAADALATVARLELAQDHPVRKASDKYDAEKEQAEVALRTLFRR